MDGFERTWPMNSLKFKHNFDIFYLFVNFYETHIILRTRFEFNISVYISDLKVVWCQINYFTMCKFL